MRYMAVVGWLALAWGASGCVADWLRERERAPLEGGESITYNLVHDGRRAGGTITFQRDGSGFVIEAASPAYPPQRVSADLRDPLQGVKAYGLSVVWLPPSARRVGADSFAGKVVREQKEYGRDVLVVQGAGTPTEYVFDKNTGFLVRLRRPRDVAVIQSTTIPGL